MVYGSSVWANNVLGSTPNDGNGYNCGVEKSQLDLFKHRHDIINLRQTYWLRDIRSASDFAYVSSHGYASLIGASNADGVRPACVLG